MANRHSEHLPEVVPDSGPQSLTYVEAYQRRGLEDGGQKYTVVYDLHTPKIATSVPPVGDVETPTTPAPAYRSAPNGAAGAVSPDTEDLGKSEEALAEKAEPKILGLKRRTFFIILIVATLVIVAAVGGGIGGFQAGKQKASSAADSADVAEEASSPSATTGSGKAEPSNAAGSSKDDGSDDESTDDDSTDEESSNIKPGDDDSSVTKSSSAGSRPAKPTATSKTAPSASQTPPKSGGGGGDTGNDDKDDDKEKEKDKDDDDGEDDRPKPGFEFRGWKNANFKGSATDPVATTGFLDLDFDVTSYKWYPKGTDCCVTMCQGKKNVGWRCTTFERDKATANFGRIFIGCGAEASEESSRCS